MRSTLFNQVAERERFLVLYADVDMLGRTQPGPANQCWKFPYPPAYFRGNSDTAAIADMTGEVMAGRAIDPQRVYVVGTSAGGLMAAIPIVVVYLLLQDQIVGGLTQGAVKG